MFFIRHPEAKAGSTDTYGGRSRNPMRVNLSLVRYYIPSDSGITFVYDQDHTVNWSISDKTKAQELIQVMDDYFDSQLIHIGFLKVFPKMGTDKKEGGKFVPDTRPAPQPTGAPKVGDQKG